MNKTQRTLGNCRAEWKIDVLAYKLNALSYEEVQMRDPTFLLQKFLVTLLSGQSDSMVDF